LLTTYAQLVLDCLRIEVAHMRDRDAPRRVLQRLM
jgi:hypothetical protein